MADSKRLIPTANEMASATVLAAINYAALSAGSKLSGVPMNRFLKLAIASAAGAVLTTPSAAKAETAAKLPPTSAPPVAASPTLTPGPAAVGVGGMAMSGIGAGIIAAGLFPGSTKAPAATPSGSADLARQAAARTASEMGSRQTVGGGGGGSTPAAAPAERGNGRVDSYTRNQDGMMVQVSGYQLPAGRR